MQNVAFTERELDWAYVACDVAPQAFETALRGLVAAGFAGANVTTPHKEAAAALAETELVSVNTLVFDDGRIVGHSTDAAVLEALTAERAARRARRGRCGDRLQRGPARRTSVRAQRGVAAGDRRRGPDRQCNLGARRGARPGKRGTDTHRPAVSGDCHCDRRTRGGRHGDQRTRGARRPGCGVVPDLDGSSGASRDDAGRRRLVLVTLRLATAGESHGPALVGILSGLPAGLELDREAIDADLARRQQGYGRSPRQKLEQDRIDVLAGLRHGRTLGTPLALLVRNRDHANWEWGMSPWPPEGEAAGKGTRPVTLPRPGHADLAGTLKYGHADARNALERASARQTAITVAVGAVAKGLLASIGIEVAGSVVEMGDVDAAKAERDTVGGVEGRARAVPPGLGWYASREDRLDARLAAALMGIQAVKGVEVGDGFALARQRGSAAHDEILRDDQGYYRETNRAGGTEGGVSNGEEIVVRAAMKPLPTLMRPLRSADLETGEPAEALVERSDVAAVEALSVVAEASVAFELARAAREKFGGDAIGDFVAAHGAYLERIPWSSAR